MDLFFGLSDIKHDFPFPVLLQTTFNVFILTFLPNDLLYCEGSSITGCGGNSTTCGSTFFLLSLPSGISPIMFFIRHNGSEKIFVH